MDKTPNPAQQRVIDDFENNIILYASAGTGKTFTVAKKVKKILESGLARPEEILCLTFTIKACDEMHEDILRENDGARGVEVRTIHSFCYQLVKEEAKRTLDSFSEPVICDDTDEEEILKKLIPDLLARYKLEEHVRASGVLKSIEELYSCDVVYLAERPPLSHGTDREAQTRRAGLYWKVCRGGSTQYVSPRGLLSAQDAERRTGERLAFSCPDCKKAQEKIENICPHCGFDFRTYIAPMEFPLGKYADYRRLVSALKHHRARQGYFSEDEEKDFQRAFLNLRATRPKEFEQVFSYRNQYGEQTDGALIAAMERYAGGILHAYQSYLRESNRLDFDDLIIEARNLLMLDEVRTRWQGRFRFIVVDEMQDTSELEYDVLKRLFARARVMMCGDFFQTIYEWRGSDPLSILGDYCKSFGAVTYMLAENYRSTTRLTSASFGYLKNVFPQFIGTYCPEEIIVCGGEEGEPIRFVECTHHADHALSEAKFLFRYLRRHPADDPAKLCVMARSNNYINRLQQYFKQFNEALPKEERLQFFTAEQDYRFFKTPIVKDVLAFFTLLVNPSDALAFERIAEKYIRGVGPATLKGIQEGTRAGLSLAAFLEADAYACGDPYRTLIDAMNWGNVVVYDTETTGLDLAKDEIIQIAAMKIDRSGNCVEQFVRFIIPETQITEGALETHGYSLDYVKLHGGMSAFEALKAFSEFARGCVLAGHNSAKFDRAILERQLAECALPPLDIKGEYDTLALARLLLPALKNHKLETLCKALHIVNARAHDAFADVEATAKVLAHFTAQILEPLSAVREKAVHRYKNRFAPFYAHYRAMQELLRANALRALFDYLKENFTLLERYEKEWERDSLEVLMLLAEEKQSGKGLESAIRELLSEAALAGSEMDVLIRKLKKIPIITVHQSKGCEFDTVLLAGADNFMFPSAAAVKAGNETEEMRVFYVAISRAKKRLVMSCHGNNSETHPRLPSPYVYKIPKEHLAWFTFDGAAVSPKE